MKLSMALSVYALGIFAYSGCVSMVPVPVDGLVSYYPFAGNGRDVVGPHHLCHGDDLQYEFTQDVKADSIQGFTWNTDFLGRPSGGCSLDGTASASPTGLTLFNSFSFVFRAKSVVGIGTFPKECNSGIGIANGSRFPFVIFPGCEMSQPTES